MTEEQKQKIEKDFAFQQANPALPDTWVQWCGSFAVLLRTDNNQDLRQWPTESAVSVVHRVMDYCTKNGLRCSRIEGGRIMV